MLSASGVSSKTDFYDSFTFNVYKESMKINLASVSTI